MAKKVKPAKVKSLPVSSIVGLASLGLIRVIFHDLHLFESLPWLSGVFAIAVAIIWVYVVLHKKSRQPFLTLLAIGAVYGIMLAVTHQIFWNSFWGTNIPTIGGNLRGVFSPGAEHTIMRSFAFISSLLTGLFMGVILGTIATILQKYLLKK